MTGAEATPNLDEMDFEDMKAGDGSLPGGLSPAEMKKLTSNPEVMAMLTNPKLQKAMEVQMSQGADALAKLLSKDPESRELLLKLNAALQQK